jgi:hypothetical protein
LCERRTREMEREGEWVLYLTCAATARAEFHIMANGELLACEVEDDAVSGVKCGKTCMR